MEAMKAARTTRPDEEIETLTERRCFVTRTHMNDTHRDLSTLYLRKRDEKNLANCLYNFKDHRALLAEMGIPNKLGVMLHGPPGTGKSSTLAAIATTLEKDIYYLHLNEVRTDADLKMAFEYVFKECANGIFVATTNHLEVLDPVIISSSRMRCAVRALS